jgi:predicted phosphodiesterase
VAARQRHQARPGGGPKDEDVKIAVLSDLHLGASGRVDRFGHDDAQFLRFLDFLEGSFERIVLLGDVLELLHGTLPGFFRQQVERVRAAHPAIFARIMGPRYTYVHGNHDLASGRLLGAPSELVIDAGTTRLLFLHGHQADFIVRNVYAFSAFCSWVGGMIERMVGARLARALDDVDHLLFKVATEGACPFQAWAIQQAVRASTDVVVTGHTHRAVVATHGDRIFMNSGTCSRGNYDFLAIDTDRGDYQVVNGF